MVTLTKLDQVLLEDIKKRNTLASETKWAKALKLAKKRKAAVTMFDGGVKFTAGKMKAVVSWEAMSHSDRVEELIWGSVSLN